MKTIAKKYEHLGGLNSFLRKPIEHEHRNPDGIGRCRHFEDGAIYWHPEIGAYEVHGAIYAKWMDLGELSSFLGYPTSDELIAHDGHSRCSCFQKGRIYLTPEAGAWSTDLHSDKAVLDWVAFNAKPLPVDWLAKYEDPTPPAEVDYSGDINFTRNQQTKGNQGYGCMIYALLHIVDILKDWEHPYSPSVSWRYAEWYWWKYHLENSNNDVPLSVLANQGFASEGRCPTNWDTKFRFNGPDPSNTDNPIPQWDEPNPLGKDEVKLNRVKIRFDNNWIKVEPSDLSSSIGVIKQFLRTYGPVWGCGEGHAKAIVGYDDANQIFKILDSYVHDETTDGGRNITYISYGKFNKKINAFSEIINIPTEHRVTGQYAYSARIRIEDNWRGTYRICIGVEGKQPSVVWTSRGRNLKNQDKYQTPVERSRVLAIDVPLPDYADSCWPPSLFHRWFLQVEDNDRDGATGKITEFTLARRYVHSDCHSIDKYRTETFSQPISIPVPDPSTGPSYPTPVNSLDPPSTLNPNPGIAIVYIPASGTSVGPAEQLKNHFSWYSIDLRGELVRPFTKIAHAIALSGKLRMSPITEEQTLANREVKLFELDPKVINKPLDWWVLRNYANTDNDGRFEFKVKSQPSLGIQAYAVAVTGAQRPALASSDCVVIDYRLNGPTLAITSMSLPEVWEKMRKFFFEDISFIANSHTKKVHSENCKWAAKIVPHHMGVYTSIDQAIKNGYNGCHFCLPKYDTR